MNLNFGGHDLVLHPSGTLLWPAQELLIVSDLHLEKGSHFAKRGFFLPPYDSHETLERLLKVRKDTNLHKILILGDCFHDALGYHRLGKKELDLFKELREFHPVWIKGNHDGNYVPEGFSAYDAYTIEGIVFRHEAVPGDTALEISGHFHPKASFVHKGDLINKDCFIEDGKKLILPAFGAYTGGMNINSKEISALFSGSFRTHVFGNNRVITL